MLLGIDDLNINSAENELGENPSACDNFEVILANKSALVLLDLGIELILKEINLLIKFHTSVW